MIAIIALFYKVHFAGFHLFRINTKLTIKKVQVCSFQEKLKHSSKD